MTISNVVLPKPSEELIRHKERLWRLKLPQDYRRFVAEYHGGIPSKCSFPCWGHMYMIERFLCILEHVGEHKYGFLDIDVTLTQIGERLSDDEDLVGEDVIPIAVMFAGDYLCMDFREDKENPSICIWFHEESGVFDPVTEKIANSFTEFIQILERTESDENADGCVVPGNNIPRKESFWKKLVRRFKC